MRSLHDYNIAWGLPIHIRLDDLDLPQVCLWRKLEIVFLNFCPVQFKHCMVGTYVKKIVYNMVLVDCCVFIEGN